MLARIIGLRRYPIKSMLGEEVTEAHLTERGLTGDRSVALIDARTGRLVSCKRPKYWARMLELRASLNGQARVHFPDGRTLACDDPALEDALSEFLGRAVVVATQAPDQAAFEDTWDSELMGVEPFPVLTQVDDDEGLPVMAAPASMLVPGAFFDFAPVHLITTRSLQSMAELNPASRYELDRFRPNIVLQTDSAAAFPEDEWEGRELRLGNQVRVKVECGTPRCVMTTLPQLDLPPDKTVLKSLAKHHKRPFFDTPCPAMGLYAQVLEAGPLCVGDAVELV